MQLSGLNGRTPAIDLLRAIGDSLQCAILNRQDLVLLAPPQVVQRMPAVTVKVGGEALANKLATEVFVAGTWEAAPPADAIAYIETELGKLGVSLRNEAALGDRPITILGDFLPLITALDLVCAAEHLTATVSLDEIVIETASDVHR